MSHVVISDPARDDVDGIWDHLALTASPEIADLIISRFYEAMYRAAERPLLHRERREFTGHPRRINVFRYAIFYEAEHDGIFVWRVLHGSRDLREIVFPPSRAR
jgi:plasmid stabilization system protein ParE